MFENPRRGRQARNFTTNVPKILDLHSSSEQIFSENWRWVPLCFCSILASQTFLPAILNHRCLKCSWKPKKMPNDLSIAPLDFDTWPVARCDVFPEDALRSEVRRSMKIEEEFYSTLKRIASVRWKKLAEKQTRGLEAKKTFYSPGKIVRIYQVRRHTDVM